MSPFDALTRAGLMAILVLGSLIAQTAAVDSQPAFELMAPGTHLPTYGNAYDLLDAGSPGELTVVALARPTGESRNLPFVVHNGTDRPQVPWVTAQALIPGSDEIVVGVAENPNAFPTLLEPGNVAIGEIRFDELVPADATIETAVTGTLPGYLLNRQGQLQIDRLGPLHLASFDPLTGTGTLTANVVDGYHLENFWRRMACFADGELRALVVIDIDALELRNGESASFSLMGVAPNECETFIFAGYGSMCGFVGNIKVCGTA